MGGIVGGIVRGVALPLALVLAPAWIVGCSGSAPESLKASPGLRTRHLAIAEARAAPASTPTIVAEFDIPSEIDGWSAEDCRVRRGKVKVDAASNAKADAMIVRRAGPKNVVRSGKLDVARINSIDVLMLAGKSVWMTAELLGDGNVLAQTRAVLCPPQFQASHVVVPFLWPLPESGQADQLVLRFNGEAETVCLLSVALEDRPPSSWAGSGEDAPLYFEGTTRVGHWVSVARPLSATSSLAAGAVLLFDYIQPGRSRRRGVSPTLVVSAEDGAGNVLRERYALPGGAAAPTGWRSGRIELGGLQPGPTRVQMQVECGDDAACVVANLAVVEPDSIARPSVLLITSDTHRADHVGASGLLAGVETPTLDALAQRGVLFTDCFSPTNSTNPSHTSLMTGVHTRDVGIGDNATPLTASAATLAEAFRASGYRTISCVSIEHLSDRVSGLGQGFDTASSPYPSGERIAGQAVDRALALLESCGDEPVFLWLHVFDAHAPYTPPDGYDRRFYDRDRDPFDSRLPDPGIPDEKLAPELHGLRDLEFPRAQYKGEVAYLDSQLQRLIDTPRFRHGAIAVVGDHGESLGEHGIYFDHSGLFPQSVHIPLILTWPGCPQGVRSAARVMHVDVGETLLAIAGAGGSTFPGRDLRERIEAPVEQDTRPRFMLSGNFTSAAIETPTHYLILTLADPGDPRLDMQRTLHQAFLFDRRSDPDCSRDVLSEQPDTARELRAQLVAWLEQRRSLGWAGGRLNDPEFLAELARLGYVDVQRAEDRPLWTADDCDWCRR